MQPTAFLINELQGQAAQPGPGWAGPGWASLTEAANWAARRAPLDFFFKVGKWYEHLPGALDAGGNQFPIFVQRGAQQQSTTRFRKP